MDARKKAGTPLLRILAEGWIVCLLMVCSVCVATPTWAQMTTPGKFAVNPSGAATYEVPIQVPPGINGMEPKLSIAYNSQAGKGSLGQGWSLQGLSAISRCPQTIAQDGQPWGVHFDANDRYCLDGQRLLLISGSHAGTGEYRTEIESFSQIAASGVAGNGPAQFVVRTKAGLIMTYGGSANSRIEAQGKPTVAVWALNRVEDRMGNVMHIEYWEDNANGQFFPIGIYYAYDQSGVCHALVRMNYDDAAGDLVPTYRAGSLIYSRKLLRSIETFAAGNCNVEGTFSPAKKYWFQYDANGTGRSQSTNRYLLGTISECGTTDNECLRPTSFTYAQSSGLFEIRPPAYYDGTGPIHAGFKFFSGDFNGDGKTDLAHFQCTNGPTGGYPEEYSGMSGGKPLQQCSSVTVWHSNGDGGFTIAPPSSMSATLAADDAFYATLPALLPFDIVRVGDFNFDGRADFVTMRISSHPLPNYRALVSLPVWRPTGDGSFPFFRVTLACLDLPIPAEFRASSLFTVGDVDGDGYSDLIWYHAPGGSNRVVEVLRSRGDFTFDILGPQAAIPQAVGNGAGALLVYADFDGDGKTDVLSLRNQDPHAVTTSFAQLNGNLAAPVAFAPSSTYDVSANNFNFQAGDFNGDGRADLIHFPNGGYVHIWLSRGDGTFDVRTFSPWGGYDHSAGGFYFVSGDFNGDGKTDLLHVLGNNTIFLWKGRGDGTFEIDGNFPQIAYPGYPVPAAANHLMQGDFNGDGKTDIAHFIGTNYLHAWLAVPFGASDLLTEPRRGADLRHAQTRLTHNPLTANGASGGVYWFYPADLPAAAAELRPPVHVVHWVMKDNGLFLGPGNPGERLFRYQYGGAAFDSRGRGFLGFRWFHEYDVDMSVIRQRWFFQAFPFTGMDQMVGTWFTPSDPWLPLSVNIRYVSAAAMGGTRYFPYAWHENDLQFDPNGALISNVLNYYFYEESPQYGNITRAETQWLTDGSVPTGDTKVTINTYWNDPTRWLLGRVRRSQVTHIKP